MPWAKELPTISFYTQDTAFASDKMIFRQFRVGPMENFNYVIGDESTKEAALVDPSWEVPKLLRFAEENRLKVKKILLTHTHPDHVQGLKEAVSKTGAAVYVHHEESRAAKALGVKVNEVDNGDEFSIGALKVKVLHTPGHAPGAVCFLFRNKLITGDTLFVEAVGRTDLPGGNTKHLFESLQQLKKLDDSTEVYPGHDYGPKPHSTIGDEKKNNPYLRCKNLEEFQNIKD